MRSVSNVNAPECVSRMKICWNTLWPLLLLWNAVDVVGGERPSLFGRRKKIPAIGLRCTVSNFLAVMSHVSDFSVNVFQSYRFYSVSHARYTHKHTNNIKIHRRTWQRVMSKLIWYSTHMNWWILWAILHFVVFVCCVLCDEGGVCPFLQSLPTHEIEGER